MCSESMAAAQALAEWGRVPTSGPSARSENMAAQVCDVRGVKGRL